MRLGIEPHSVQYAYSKVSEAVSILATHPGDVRKRLCAAYLTLCEASHAILPPHIRSELEWIHEQLNRFPARYGEGTLHATLKCIRNSTGVKVAKRILLVQALLESHVVTQRPE
jgi:hypothetical protein